MEMSYAILVRQANDINLQRNYLTNGNMTLYWQQNFLKIHVGALLLFQKPMNKYLAYLYVLECIFHSEYFDE